jgi:hypothetical protein
VVIDPETDIPIKKLIRYAEDGTFYLLSYAPTEHFAQADYIAAETVAKSITLLADKDLVSLINIVSGLQAEVRPPWFILHQPTNPPGSVLHELAQSSGRGISFFSLHSRPSRLLLPKSSSPSSQSSSAVSNSLSATTCSRVWEAKI